MQLAVLYFITLTTFKGGVVVCVVPPVLVVVVEFPGFCWKTKYAPTANINAMTGTRSIALFIVRQITVS